MSKARPTVPHLFSIRELADHLGISAKTISRWIDDGSLHAHRLGRQIRISEDDAASFIAARRR